MSPPVFVFLLPHLSHHLSDINNLLQNIPSMRLLEGIPVAKPIGIAQAAIMYFKLEHSLSKFSRLSNY